MVWIDFETSGYTTVGVFRSSEEIINRIVVFVASTLFTLSADVVFHSSAATGAV